MATDQYKPPPGGHLKHMNPILFLLILFSQSGTGSLRVEMGAEPVKSLRNEEAFIPCSVTDWGPGDISPPKLSVEWTQKTLNGSKGQVYLYVSGTHTPTRPGSYISDRDLITGNVGLHLPRVQFTDEGEYTCTVIYTPYKAVGQSVLQVSAPPAPSLTPTDITIVLGTEKTVTCEANEFYPKDITFQWIKYPRGSGNVPLQDGISYTHPKKNKDGTFNQRSFLRINPTLEDNGNVYSCNVSHRSMGTDLQLNLTLSVKEPDTAKKLITAAVLGAAAAVALVALIIYHYMTFWQKEPPKLSPITRAEHLVHMNEATLSCQISGFRPKPIRITLCLQRKGGEVMEIYSWDSEAQTGSAAPVAHHRDEQSVVIAPEREGLMGNGNVQYLPPAQRALRVEMVPVITTSKYRISNCQCTIHITPDIEEDDGAELTVRVTHSALRGPISVSHQLKVTGVHSPTVSDIQCTPTQPQGGKPVRLFCAINNFFPQYCSTRWYRGQEILPQSSVKEDQVEDPESGLFSRTTAVQYTPTVNDHGTEFCVEITHHKENIKKTFPMKLKGLPYIESITCNRDSPKVGEELTLQCKVTGANARNITAKWRAGSDPITGEMKTEINRDTVTFLLRLISTVEHYGKIFTCLIRHGDLQEPMERNITLKWADNPPTLSEIEVLPTNPEVHKEATFRITISGFSQKDHQVRWFLQGSQIPESLKKVCSDPKIDAPKEEEDAPKLIETSELQIGEDGLYVCSSTLRYTPTDKDNGTFIRCVFTAKGIISKKKYQLSLTGAEMKEPMIECVTLDPRKGEAVTLECIIRGVGVSHGIFSWSDGIFPIDEGLIDNSNLPDGSGCISRVTFTPDDGHIRFEATFNSGTIEKTYQLPWV